MQIVEIEQEIADEKVGIDVVPATAESYLEFDEDVDQDPQGIVYADASEDNSIFLGLRVYTSKEAPVIIDGQLRHEMEAGWRPLPEWL